jgi:hypothetical protein
MLLAAWEASHLGRWAGGRRVFVSHNGGMGRTGKLTHVEIAWLAGGERAAVRTGLAALHARGLLTGRSGMASRTGSLRPESEPLERALFSALYGHMGPRELANQRQVRHAFNDLRKSLVARGLVRSPWRRVALPVDVRPGLVLVMVLTVAACWFLPRRTLAGTGTLRALRSAHAPLLAPGNGSVGPGAGRLTRRRVWPRDPGSLPDPTRIPR